MRLLDFGVGYVLHTNLIKNNLRRFELCATAEARIKAETISKKLSEDKKTTTQLNIDFKALVMNIRKSTTRNDLEKKLVRSSTSRK